MSPTDSVRRDERLRLFLALRVPDDVVEEIARWQRDQLPGVRLVPREHLHITLAFLSHRPAVGYLTISNALQWRLQYSRVIEQAGRVGGVQRIV